MQGNERVLDLLNDVLTAELTAVNQYFVDAKMCQNWGYDRLAAKFREDSIDEMKDADSLIERILYLDGVPNMQRLGPVREGESVPEKLQLGLDVETEAISRLFQAILVDWTNAAFDPFASPAETGSAFGPKNGSNKEAITRHRVTAKRMIGAPGDEPVRTDDNGFPINRQFTDVPQDAPEVHAEPGFEHEVVSVNLFAYLSRSDVTWNPSVVSVCKNSLYCPTTEEYILPIIHGNDRVEWFVQLTDEIQWEVEDRDTGVVRARVTMKAGDVAAMPADIRHRGFSPKRSMLLVWENASPELPALYAAGKMPPAPVQF